MQTNIPNLNANQSLNRELSVRINNTLQSDVLTRATANRNRRYTNDANQGTAVLMYYNKVQQLMSKIEQSNDLKSMLALAKMIGKDEHCSINTQIVYDKKICLRLALENTPLPVDFEYLNNVRLNEDTILVKNKPTNPIQIYKKSLEDQLKLKEKDQNAKLIWILYARLAASLVINGQFAKINNQEVNPTKCWREARKYAKKAGDFEYLSLFKISPANLVDRRDIKESILVSLTKKAKQYMRQSNSNAQNKVRPFKVLNEKQRHDRVFELKNEITSDKNIISNLIELSFYAKEVHTFNDSNGKLKDFKQDDLRLYALELTYDLDNNKEKSYYLQMLAQSMDKHERIPFDLDYENTISLYKKAINFNEFSSTLYSELANLIEDDSIENINGIDYSKQDLIKLAETKELDALLNLGGYKDVKNPLYNLNSNISNLSIHSNASTTSKKSIANSIFGSINTFNRLLISNQVEKEKVFLENLEKIVNKDTAAYKIFTDYINQANQRADENEQLILNLDNQRLTTLPLGFANIIRPNTEIYLCNNRLTSLSCVGIEEFIHIPLVNLHLGRNNWNEGDLLEMMAFNLRLPMNTKNSTIIMPSHNEESLNISHLEDIDAKSTSSLTSIKAKYIKQNYGGDLGEIKNVIRSRNKDLQQNSINKKTKDFIGGQFNEQSLTLALNYISKTPALANFYSIYASAVYRYLIQAQVLNKSTGMPNIVYSKSINEYISQGLIIGGVATAAAGAVTASALGTAASGGAGAMIAFPIVAGTLKLSGQVTKFLLDQLTSKKATKANKLLADLVPDNNISQISKHLALFATMSLRENLMSNDSDEEELNEHIKGFFFNELPLLNRIDGIKEDNIQKKIRKDYEANLKKMQKAQDISSTRADVINLHVFSLLMRIAYANRKNNITDINYKHKLNAGIEKFFFYAQGINATSGQIFKTLFSKGKIDSFVKDDKDEIEIHSAKNFDNQQSLISIPATKNHLFTNDYEKLEDYSENNADFINLTKK